MLDPQTEVCVCNSVTAQEIVQCIKEHGLKTLEELLAQDFCPIGDKCEACKDEGFHNDGINLPLVFSLVQKGQL